jgi:hypothetical protein
MTSTNLLMAILGSLEILKKRLPDDPSMMPLLDNASQGADRGVAPDPAHARLFEKTGSACGGRRHPSGRGRHDGVRAAIRRRGNPDPDGFRRRPSRRPDRRGPAGNRSPEPYRQRPRRHAQWWHDHDRWPLECRLQRIPSEPRAPGLLRLSVSDTGEGMDEETLERAATPFFTTRASARGPALASPWFRGLSSSPGASCLSRAARVKEQLSRSCSPLAHPTESSQPSAEATPRQALPELPASLKYLLSMTML